jgi:hypothetical protein
MSKNHGARAAALAAVLAGGIACSGCARSPATTDYDLVYTEVTPIEYARILCQLIPLQERHTCMTSVIQHYRDGVDEDRTPEQVINGPFVMILDRQLYRGRYVSQPFAAAFTVRNDTGGTCRGRYNAFAGDTRAVFSVWCDRGARGSANIILDQEGRNGIGKVIMEDGRRGQIVFGYAAVGGDFY